MLAELKSEKKYFIYLKILIVFVSLLLITITSFYPADYTHLSCQNNQSDNVVCVLKKKEFYGLLNHLKIEFNLQSIDISKTSIEQCLLSRRSATSTLKDCYQSGDTITINTYKIYLQSETW